MSKYKHNQFRGMTGKRSVITLTVEELNRIKKEVRKQAVDELSKFDVEILLTCFAQVLRSQYGWGHKRIFRALNGVDELFGKVLEGELSDVDMRKQLEEEVGIRIKCDEGENNGA